MNACVTMPADACGFATTLRKHGLELRRDRTTTLQVNVGFRCNQACRHCHLEAGPSRQEMMDAETADTVVHCAGVCRFEAIDITGGAPELNPNLPGLIARLARLTPRILLRSNLTAAEGRDFDRLADLCREFRVVLVTSFPSISEGQTASQRGPGTFAKIVDAIRRLNLLGYGMPGSGLELNLVSNPTGAFLPMPQGQAEKRFREVLTGRWGLSYSNLHCFANVPLGRHLRWLDRSGNLLPYLQKLEDHFNPCALPAVMCRSHLSMDYRGYLHDCDFNLACGLPLGGRKTHILEMRGPPEPGSPIATGDHCYACTAGAGFTCGGSITA